jgi:nucleoside-diphosphate-sugar epimerase
MSVHGPSPGPECASEASATIRRYGESYCDSKAEEEKIVQQAITRDNFPAVILRPTVVYGPYSAFVLQAISAASTGKVSLIDEGSGICNAVYVDDVCDAIFAALTSDRPVGQAMFINGDSAITWRQFTLEFAGLLNPAVSITNVSSEAAERFWSGRRSGFSGNAIALKNLLISSQFHRQLSTVPALGDLIHHAKTAVGRLVPEDRAAALRRRNVMAATSIPVSQESWPNLGRVKRETVSIRFANSKAKALLGWEPRYDFNRGVQLTRTWLEFARLIPASHRDEQIAPALSGR